MQIGQLIEIRLDADLLSSSATGHINGKTGLHAWMTFHHSQRPTVLKMRVVYIETIIAWCCHMHLRSLHSVGIMMVPHSTSCMATKMCLSCFFSMVEVHGPSPRIQFTLQSHDPIILRSVTPLFCGKRSATPSLRRGYLKPTCMASPLTRPSHFI